MQEAVDVIPKCFKSSHVGGEQNDHVTCILVTLSD